MKEFYHTMEDGWLATGYGDIDHVVFGERHNAALSLFIFPRYSHRLRNRRRVFLFHDEHARMSSADEGKPNLHKRRKRKEGHLLASYST
jgi:hypothetical protein